MMWVITFPGMLIIPAVVAILVWIVHGPEVRRNMRRMEAERAALARAKEDQPKKTSASA